MEQKKRKLTYKDLQEYVAYVHFLLDGERRVVKRDRGRPKNLPKGHDKILESLIKRVTPQFDQPKE